VKHKNTKKDTLARTQREEPPLVSFRLPFVSFVEVFQRLGWLDARNSPTSPGSSSATRAI